MQYDNMLITLLMQYDNMLITLLIRSVIKRLTDSTTGTTVDRQILRVDRRVIRVDKRVLGMNKRMNRRVLPVDKRVLRMDKRILQVDKRVLRVDKQYYEYCECSSKVYGWPDEFCKNYEWQEGYFDNNYPALMSTLMQESKITVFFFKTTFGKSLFVIDYIYLHL